MTRKRLSWIGAPLLTVFVLSSCVLRMPASVSSFSEAASSPPVASSIDSSSSSSLSSSSDGFVSSSAIDSVSSASSSSAESGAFVPPGYHLTWSDEFEGSNLNSASWSHQIGDGSDYGITGWGNGEAECYAESNASVEGGLLRITAQKETVAYAGRSYAYTSSRIRTSGKVSFAYGYAEARMRLPAIQGMWPAFWMLPESPYQGRGWPTSGEIDIMENKGREPYKVGATTHSATSSFRDGYHTGSATLERPIDEWHVYGMEWTAEEIGFFADGILYHSVSKATWVNDCQLYEGGPAPFDRPFYLILNLAVGGQYDGNRLPPDSFVSAEMDVDYVRVYGI